MPNYKETAITGTKWTRARQVYVDNPLDAISSITFVEEEVVNDGMTTFTKPSNQITEQFIDPNTPITLLNPNDDSIIGTSSYMQVYVLLYSLYKQLALARDAAETAAQTTGA